MYPEMRSRLYQGDIMLPISRNAIVSDYYKWPKAIVPYTIHYNFSKYKSNYRIDNFINLNSNIAAFVQKYNKCYTFSS